MALRPPWVGVQTYNRISVTTPVGAALLGLTPGQPFSWTTDDGRPRALVVRSVAERS